MSKKIEMTPEMLGKVEGISTMQCPDEEIAAFLGISYSTLKRRKLDTPGLSEAIERGRDTGRQMLRAAQWSKAIGDKDNGSNVTMMIWLGKQYLGQSDKTDLLRDGKPFEFTIAINGEHEETEQDPGQGLVH